MSGDTGTPRDKRRNTQSGIRDVARAASVSIATVSRALNKPDKVSPETRGRVLEAAERMFYIPDGAARSLSSQKSHRIGAVIPTINDSIFASYVEALQHRLGQFGYALLIGIDCFDPLLELQEVRGLIESGVDAVVLCGAQRAEQTYELLENRDLPYLITHVPAQSSRQVSVSYDNRQGAVLAAKHLLDLGHREIGVMDYPRSRNDRSALRIAGFAETLRAFGLDLPPERIVERPFSIEDGRIGLRQLLASAKKPTAVFCGNDVLAVGALFEAKAQGIPVPEALSVIGYDDLELAAQITPPLTTLHVPTGEMGTRSADTIRALLEGEKVPSATRIETKLVCRASTGPAPGAGSIVSHDDKVMQREGPL